MLPWFYLTSSTLPLLHAVLTSTLQPYLKDLKEPLIMAMPETFDLTDPVMSMRNRCHCMVMSSQGRCNSFETHYSTNLRCLFSQFVAFLNLLPCLSTF